MDEQIIYLSPKDELINVRERLEKTEAGRIILIVPSQSQLRSHVVWRLLRSRVRELGQDVRIVCPDRQIRNVAKTAGFPVAESLESSPSGRSRPINRPVRRDTGENSSQGPGKQEGNGEEVTRALPPGHQQMAPLTSDNSSKLSNSGDMNTEFAKITPSSFEIEDIPYDSHFDPQIEPMSPINPHPGAGDQEEGEIDSLEDYYDVRSIREAAQNSDTGDVAPASENTEASRGNREQSNNIPITSEIEDDPIGSNEDDLDPIPDLPMRSTPSAKRRPYGASVSTSTTRREPQPIIQPSPQARNVPINPTFNQPRKPVSSSSGRVVATPPYSSTKPRNTSRPFGESRRGGTGGSTARRLTIPLVVIVSILLILFVVVGFAMRDTFFPGIANSVTATITPASIDLNDTYVISGILGAPDASQRQIQARLLSDTTTSQAKTLKVTGAGQIPATAARGSLTFYNALPYSQAIVAGTVFIDNNSVQVVNDKPAIIPAARPPAEGTVTIPAHSITMGIKGNIPAFAFNDVPCCVAGITIKNQAKFSGGQDQRDYTFVQQSDIDSVVNAEKASLILHAESVLQAEFFQNEQLINPDKCTSESISDHVAGDRATSVTVALTVTCTGEVYDRQAAQLMAANLLTSKAMFDLGAGYALVGRIATTIKQIEQNVVKQGTIYLLVSAKGIWANKFSEDSQRMLAKLIAGKKLTDAQSLLIHHVGIANADIKVFGIAVNMVPDDPEHIIIVIQNVHGF